VNQAIYGELEAFIEHTTRTVITKICSCFLLLWLFLPESNFLAVEPAVESAVILCEQHN